MNCEKARQRLTSTVETARPAALEQHVEDCQACRQYATRRQAALELFADHRSEAQPDAGFASRVVARLEQPPLETLGWAALRLLPATLALVLALAWFVFGLESPAAYEESAVPTEDLVSWILEQAENGS
jgi:predicted anti-sigma-YlaC factor YlaD